MDGPLDTSLLLGLCFVLEIDNLVRPACLLEKHFIQNKCSKYITEHIHPSGWLMAMIFCPIFSLPLNLSRILNFTLNYWSFLVFFWGGGVLFLKADVTNQFLPLGVYLVFYIYSYTRIRMYINTHTYICPPLSPSVSLYVDLVPMWYLSRNLDHDSFNLENLSRDGSIEEQNMATAQSECRFMTQRHTFCV